MITPLSPTQMLSTMIEREVTWVGKYIDSFRGRKFVIFAAGLYAKKFYRWFLNDYGIEAEFFIDNNPDLVGKAACEKPIMLKPWESIENFNNDYFVLISTSGANYHHIAKQLDDVGVPYLSSDSFQVAYFWERCKKVAGLLDDDFSKMSYLGPLWYWLTYDNSFIQTVENQYFAVKDFAQPIGEVIADVGAYVGDSTEEYIKRALGNCTIYAFEPDEKLLEALNTRVKRLKMEWALSNTAITIVPAGASSKTGSVPFTLTGNQDTHVASCDELGKELSVHTLDDYFSDKQSPTIIKADIEGAELDMLFGAADIIRKNKPKLAICIYHSISDYVRVFECIYKFINIYKNYAVRNHSGNYCETVLYCW